MIYSGFVHVASGTFTPLGQAPTTFSIYKCVACGIDIDIARPVHNQYGHFMACGCVAVSYCPSCPIPTNIGGIRYYPKHSNLASGTAIVQGSFQPAQNQTPIWKPNPFANPKWDW